MAVTGITETRRRVKVYSFNEKMQWEDMGTGHVSVNYVERLQSLIITVRSEDDGKLLGFCFISLSRIVISIHQLHAHICARTRYTCIPVPELVTQHSRRLLDQRVDRSVIFSAGSLLVVKSTVYTFDQSNFSILPWLASPH